MPFVDLFRFIKKFDGLYVAGKVQRNKMRENISKIVWKKSENPLNFGKKSRNPEKNCQVPKIFVRFFQNKFTPRRHRSKLPNDRGRMVSKYGWLPGVKELLIWSKGWKKHAWQKSWTSFHTIRCKSLFSNFKEMILGSGHYSWGGGGGLVNVENKDWKLFWPPSRLKANFLKYILCVTTLQRNICPTITLSHGPSS
jgi:hypothetical protein